MTDGGKPPVLSVVLATYARPDVLERNLRHLANQTLNHDAYEVIVIDDGSPDDTPAVVERYKAQAPYRLTFLRHANRGPGYTQNRGIREARGSLVLLIADDILLEPGALAAHVEAHIRRPGRSVVILGNVRQSPDLPQTAFQRKWDPFEFRRLTADQELPYTLFWACNISMKRQFMLDHGMFQDERGPAGAAAHEDVEVGHRLSQHGLQLFHEPAALGYHYHPETLQTAIARSYQRGRNWDSAFRRMPNVELIIRQRLHSVGSLFALRRSLEERRRYLLPGDSSVPRLAIDAIMRAVLFNSVTVNWVWLPLMGMAERHDGMANVLHPRFYRGVIVYYFRKGWRDASAQI